MERVNDTCKHPSHKKVSGTQWKSIVWREKQHFPFFIVTYVYIMVHKLFYYFVLDHFLIK